MLLDDEAPGAGRATTRRPFPDAARLVLARDLLRSGRVREARTALETLLAAPGDVLVRAAARGALVEALLAQGELRAAATLLDTAADEARARRRDGTGGGVARRALAHDVHAGGELAAARGDTSEAADLHRRAGQLVAGAGAG